LRDTFNFFERSRKKQKKKIRSLHLNIRSYK
jgi:hypothetical protein